jgi:leader peptidase (prepilin peptidase)/N-methyltransferase
LDDYFNAEYLIFWQTAVVILGLIVGSFLNVVIYRLPKMLELAWQAEARFALEQEPQVPSETFNLAAPRSSCPNCNTQISALHNIPLFSYLWLGGKCGQCRTSISWQYPVVELITALLSLLVFLKFGPNSELVFALIFTWSLIALSGIDAKHYILPDNIVLPILWLGLFANLSGRFASLPDAVLGAIFGYGVLWVCFWGFKLVTGKDGMGYGDFKLMAAIGAWFGWQSLPATLLISSLTGAVVGIALIIFNKNDRTTAIPFGPYIAVSGWLMMMYGPQIRGLLMQLMNPTF